MPVRTIVAAGLLALVSPLMSQPVLVPIPERGGEFLLNTTTSRSQQRPAVAPLPDGGFVAVWEDDSGSDWVVRGQRFDIDAAKQGSEFIAPVNRDGTQFLADVAGLHDGGFVVVWEDQAQRSDDADCGFDLVTASCAVRGQVFNADGSRRGSEFRVNSTTAGAQFSPSVAPNRDGFVVVFTDSSASGGDTSDLAVRGQRFASDGSRVGSEFLVNTTTDDWQEEADVARLSDGGFLVAWEDGSGTGADQSFDAIRAQRFSADGAPVGGEFLVNTTTDFGQRVPSAAGLDDGGFVIAWEDNSQCCGDDDHEAIQAQVFDADASPRGGELLVNSVTDFGQTVPEVAALDAGGFAVVWEDASGLGGDTEPTAVKAKVFDANGLVRGGEYRVNFTTGDAQERPATARLPEGGFVVAWEDASQSGGDTSLDAIRGQIYSGYLFTDRFEG